MKETIIFAPGANNTELTRSLARFGKSTFGFRIFSAVELSRFALMRSGQVLPQDFLPQKQEASVIDTFIRTIPYFASASFADSEKIAAALFSLRQLIPDNEQSVIETGLQGGEFPEKNQSLSLVYNQYLSVLKKENMTDTIGIIRKAIDAAAPLGCAFLTLKEFPLSPLETALADAIAPDRKELALTDLIENQGAEKIPIDYKECYGSANEVEAVFEYIAQHNLPLDQCTIVVAGGSTYQHLFCDFATLHNINISFGCGLPILYSNPAKLLKLIYDWNTVGYNGTDALRLLITSDAFDRKKFLTALKIEDSKSLYSLIEIAGNLRLSGNKAENEARLLTYKQSPDAQENAALLNSLESFSQELSLGESKLIQKYAVIRNGFSGRVDRSALSVVCDTLDAYYRFSGNASAEPIIPEILKKNVCSENSREGALFVTGISGVLSSFRENLFIVGLSASNFPGSPRENYLLLDSDYLLFADDNTAPTSKNIINRNKETLHNVLHLTEALGIKTHLSYAGYQIADLKTENPSSVLFEIFKKQAGDNATMQDFQDVLGHIGYFGQKISDCRLIGRAFNDGNTITFTEQKDDTAPVSALSDRSFSPTAIDDFFGCPRHFFLTRILGIPEPEDDDPFRVISAADTGSLVHSLMEALANEPVSKDDFLLKSADAFDGFLQKRPPIHADSAKAEKEVFLRIMKNAFELDPKNEVLASEQMKSVTHPSGVKLHGIPDRIEKRPDGSCLIADYKTGRNINHKANDIDTCLQVVIYAFLAEESDIPISHCEYRYLRDGKTVPCRYDDQMRDKLNQKLTEFKEALESGDFPAVKSEKNCRYCKLQSLCNNIPEKEEKTQ